MKEKNINFIVWDKVDPEWKSRPLCSIILRKATRLMTFDEYKVWKPDADIDMYEEEVDFSYDMLLPEKAIKDIL